jgi:Ca2+:H+ antiporter
MSLAAELSATSTFNRLKPAHYMLPIGCLALAAAIRLGGAPVEHLSVSLRVTLSLFATCLVFATVFIVLHHAERIAHRIGEPYGTLVLTLAVTTIEVSVIVSMMLHGENNPSLARESVFSTVMIVCGGVVGICLTFGGLRHRHQDLKRQGTNAYLAVLIALSVLTLILPDFTLASPPGTFAPMQLAFVSVLSVMLYGSFVFAQMARHRDDFVEELINQKSQPEMTAEHYAIGANIALLATGLIGIVLLTEQIAGGIEDGLKELHFAQADALVGAFIATLVLLPESVSAIRAALNNELQRSLNVALGSACATIGLTIPAVALASLVTGRGLTLGLESGDMVLLLLALSVSIVSFSTGRTTVLTGLVHLVVFFAYLLLIFVP